MPEKRITLALQGGSSHGAFKWGALERLLEDERIVIEGLSGAGAINSTVPAHARTWQRRNFRHIGARSSLVPAKHPA